MVISKGTALTNLKQLWKNQKSINNRDLTRFIDLIYYIENSEVKKT
jgi:hypothetical protein